MLALAVTAKMFGQRPSALAGIGDRVVALDFDICAAVALHWHENPELEAEPEVLWNWAEGNDRKPVKLIRLGVDF